MCKEITLFANFLHQFYILVNAFVMNVLNRNQKEGSLFVASFFLAIALISLPSLFILREFYSVHISNALESAIVL